MRRLKEGSTLNVRAIAGTHVVTLAWDFVTGKEHKRDGLLGFAIERTELAKNGGVAERFWLRGIKRFKHKDEGLPPGTPVPTSEHPIQSFQWGDYTPKPETSYRYKVVPVYGEPKLLKPDEGSATTVAITTEPEDVGPSDSGRATHDIYFNRGVAGSQAYAMKFGRTRPDETKPESDQMKWLSRGLFEALTSFIKRASSERFALRAMLYEFHYKPVGDAFREAARAGADVDIRYEAQSYKAKNEKMIPDARIKRLCKPQKRRAGIRHNKFIVLIHNDKPVAVWTGSTNISAGGIFGHSNVGHTIWDPKLAERYLAFWIRLSDPNVDAATLKAENLKVEATPAPGSAPPANKILTLFCPRDVQKTVQTLHWYADVMSSAQRITCMTFAFNLDDMFAKVLQQESTTLRYSVFDKNIKKAVSDLIEKTHNSVIAVGNKLSRGDMETFIGEELTGFNRNRYIHDKFILADPFGANPIVVTGTANFSKPSQYQNDENMLAIVGNTRVADIYFGEFMRVFDHLYSRYIVAKLKKAGRNDPDAGYLKEDSRDWVPDHFKRGRKSLRREYFMGR